MECSKCNKIVEKYARGKTCRQCYNAYMAAYHLKRYYERRAKALVLLGGHCASCSTTEGLEIDHIDRTTKRYDVGQAGLAEQKFWDEVLTKCHLLCRQCHRLKSAQERAVEHGGGISGKRNCPCAPCRARKNEYMRTWKRERSKPL